MTQKAITMACIVCLGAPPLDAWGFRGHTVANLAAVETIGAEGPTFLKAHKAYIGHLGPVPDTWRSPSEPYLRISEDPNHGWYTESFDFMKEIPRSRTEFTLRVYDEYLRVGKSDPERALAADIAFYMGWLGHYIADAAQPLHNSRHHDGWDGDNPKGYTRDPKIHGRFESEYVDLIAVTEGDVVPIVPTQARHFDDPWTAILDHMIEARGYAEEVYRLDLTNAFRDRENAGARKLVHARLTSGAAFLRDLAHTAWIESAKTDPPVKPIEVPNNPDNPRYNPATGSAPAPARR